MQLWLWLSELIPAITTFLAFLYGAKHFIKNSVALYLHIVTMAMGCYSLGCFYHVCQTLIIGMDFDGFTPVYLGKIGFFLFLFSANYGQMDRLIDDGSKDFRLCRIIAFAGPVLAVLLFLPCAFSQVHTGTLISYLIVWVIAIPSMYYNLKHALAPDMGFGFIKAIRPYNISALIASALELLILCSWLYDDTPLGAMISTLISAVFSVLCVVTMYNLGKGALKWTI